ncbi:MAG TPA: D-alanyl-D-alanine carboxypeptidase/D-alanyl-D-alanine-endopeptidase [Solirubrobacteraceae bacterium]|jgi:D-alanyl-D-alanine carboxypeptidase/D-alanyl-D-alanine-endopeptidase (penicillin-binding protein 4)|nr:D-alanyl-D-alanine carboxypeptidase/D-alanyl-D-alanine-endopeptidase [Solirubrobacteraceae bacterium]
MRRRAATIGVPARSLAAVVGVMLGMLGAAPVALGATKPAEAARSPQAALASKLNSTIRHAGGRSGAYVLDLDTGQSLFSYSPDVGRLPASVEKLYTTSTALLDFGANTTLTTSIYGAGTLNDGHWTGTLYIKGGGDPTFGSASFDHFAYGGGATMQRLVANLIRTQGITSIQGRVIGDESYFDSLRGTPATGYGFSTEVEGSLSALVYNRGLINQGSSYVLHPALFAAQQFVSALRSAGVKVAQKLPISTGRTPAGTGVLAEVNSPRMGTLIKLTNTPSDNFFAETLIKDIGAKFGAAGTTAAGAAVVRSLVASKFGIHPQLNDGSGLSRSDFTTPRQVVTLLSRMASNIDFVSSLAVAGKTGTLEHEMNGTIAQGRCEGKTGTLSDAANLVGYCQARDGHKLAFAFLMNSVFNTDVAHKIEANMAVMLAKYNG